MNKEIEMLYKTIEAKDNIINEQVLEIARLRKKIEKAIEEIKTREDYKIRFKKLLAILGDKEK